MRARVVCARVAFTLFAMGCANGGAENNPDNSGDGGGAQGWEAGAGGNDSGAADTGGGSSGSKGDSGTTVDSGGGGVDSGGGEVDSGGGSDSGGMAEGGGGGNWWQPGTGELPWQWEIDHEINNNSASDMGTGDTAYGGGAALAPAVYDIDGFDNTAADVAALHAVGKKVICYIEVGAAENYRPDYSMFQAADLGKVEQGYPNEKYIDIRSASVVSIIEARIAMCAQKGFDGIEPDIDDSYTDDTGFSITEADNIAFLGTLSAYAHSVGVAWGLKNGGDGGDPSSFVPGVLQYIDFAVVEEPYFLQTIGFFSPLLYNAGKAFFVAEYTNDTASTAAFCPQALSDHTNAALFDVGLDGMVRQPCQ